MSVNCRTPPSRRFDPTGNRFGAASCRSDPSGSDLDPPYSVLIKKRDLATASRFRSHEAQSFLASKNQATTLAIPSRPRVTIQFQLNRDDVFKLHKEREVCRAVGFACDASRSITPTKTLQTVSFHFNSNCFLTTSSLATPILFITTCGIAFIFSERRPAIFISSFRHFPAWIF